MTDFSHVPTLEEGYDLAVVALRELVREILPDHSLILANKGSTVPTKPYVSFRTTGFQGENEGTTNGNKPIHYEMREDESELYVYQYKTTISVKVYKDNALMCASRIRQALNRNDLHYKYFSSTRVLGVSNASFPVDEPTLIDMQEWEEGARLEITLGFLAKEIISTTSGIIQTVEYVSEVDLTQDRMDPDFIESANEMYGYMNYTENTWDNEWN